MFLGDLTENLETLVMLLFKVDSVVSPLKKGVFGSLSYKVLFDYQMVTFEEIIKNDFFKWAPLLLIWCQRFLQRWHQTSYVGA